MTNVKLGDASIRITLDPEAAKREADALKKELDKIEERKKKVAEEMERTANGEQSPTAAKPGPNSPAQGRPGQHFKAGMGTSGMGDDEGASKRNGSTIRSFKRMLDLGLTAVKFGAATAKKLSVAAGAMEEKFKGTMFEGIAKKGTAFFKDAAEKAVKVESYGAAIPDTFTDVIDYNTAALKLGGKFPEDQDKLIADFYKINQAQEELRKSFSLATEELMLTYVQRGFTTVIQEAIKRSELK